MALDKDFVQPEDITAPRAHWSLIKVLFKGDPEGFSIALGYWTTDEGEKYVVLAVRWNACEWRPVGNPHSRGLPTWFVLPEPLVEPIIESKIFDSKTREFIRNFIPKAR
jgi:hypothetical protein